MEICKTIDDNRFACIVASNVTSNLSRSVLLHLPLPAYIVINAIVLSSPWGISSNVETRNKKIQQVGKL